MKVKDLDGLVRKYYWLKGIAEDYDNQLTRLKKEGDAVRVDSVSFICRSDRMEKVALNCHRTISPKPFINAIKKCLEDVKAEMVSVREEIEKVVELD